MPLYDFECPRCGEEQTRRLFSPVAAPHKWHIDRGKARESDARRAEREARRLHGLSEQRRRRRADGAERSGGRS